MLEELRICFLDSFFLMDWIAVALVSLWLEFYSRGESWGRRMVPVDAEGFRWWSFAARWDCDVCLATVNFLSWTAWFSCEYFLLFLAIEMVSYRRAGAVLYDD